MIQLEQLHLTKKSEHILCPTHNQSISYLNIGKNTKLTDRLICQDCNTLNQQVLNLNQIEQHLYKMYQEEQQIISSEQQKVNDTINSFRAEISHIEKQFEIKLSILINKIQGQFQKLKNALTQQIFTYQQRFIQRIEQHSKTKLSQLIENIANCQVIDDQTLQQTADFISNQSIFNGELQMKDKVLISDSIDKSISENSDKFLFYLNSIQTVLKHQKVQEQVENQQQQQLEDKKTLKYNDPFQLDGHSNYIGAVAMSNNGQLMASGDYSGQIILWNQYPRSINQKYNCENWITDLVFSLDDNLLGVAQYKKPQDILIINLSSASSTFAYIRLQGNSDTVWRIAFTSNSQFLISGGQDCTLRIWNVYSQKSIAQNQLSNIIYGVNISKDQQYISACCKGGQAYLFDGSNIQHLIQIAQWKAHDHYTNCTTFTQNSKLLLTCGYEDIKLWNIHQLLSDVKGKSPLKQYRVNNYDSYWSISVRLDDSIIVSNNGKIRIWNMEKGTLIQTLDVPSGYSFIFDRNFSVSKDMNYIITGSMNKMLIVYELSPSQQID